jgi:hypothetical protein
MTDFTQLSDKELSEAIDFHRRQRNMSRGVNESMHMRQVQTVRLLEAEEARRLEEAQVKKPTKSERSIALPNGEPNRSADMKVNKVAYALDKEPKKKVSLPKAPWNEEAELDEAAFDDESKAHDRHYEKQTPAVQNALDKYTRQGMSYKQAHAKISNPLTGHRLRKEITPLHEEQIDELKKSTLASYVKKASTDQYLKGQAVQYHTNKAQTADGVFAKQSKEKHYDAADKALKKASNRDTGIGRAVDRLAKEEVEQIDEISKDTVNSYWKKAAAARYPLDVKARKAQDQKTNRIRSGKPLAGYKPKDELSPEEKRTHMNRIKGMNNAGKRLFRSEEVEQIDENGIEGWKHAGSDISKMRAAAGKDVKLVRLKKDGAESKLHDATKMFRSEDEAQKHHDRVVGLNPKSKIAHNLYVDGKHVKTLGESVELDESDNSVQNLAIQAIQSKLKKAKVSYRDPNAKTAREEDRIAKQLAAKAKLKKEEVELDEASYRDSGYANMLKASRKADKEADKMRAKHEKEAKKAGEPKAEFKEEADLRITKVYNKWPKKATYAVHNADRSYHKEFDSMEAAKAHHAEKSGK